SERDHRERVQGRAHCHRIQFQLHAGFSGRRRGRTDQHRTEGRAVRRADASACGRQLPLSLRDYADAHLKCFSAGKLRLEIAVCDFKSHCYIVVRLSTKSVNRPSPASVLNRRFTFYAIKKRYSVTTLRSCTPSP